MKTAMRSHIRVRKAIIKKILQTKNSEEDEEKRGPSHTAGENVNWCGHNREQYGDLKKQRKKTTRHPTNPTTEHTPEKPVIQKLVNSRVHCTIWVQWIITILAINSAFYDRICNRPRYLSTEEWIKQLWYIYWMEYYSAIKRNKFESVLDRCMNLEPLIQSKVGQKNKYHILTHMYEIQKNGTDEPICRLGIETLR